MESFDEYKKTLESNFSNFKYLYDGDIISSSDHYISKSIDNNQISPKIYNRMYIRNIQKKYLTDDK